MTVRCFNVTNETVGILSESNNVKLILLSRFCQICSRCLARSYPTSRLPRKIDFYSRKNQSDSTRRMARSIHKYLASAPHGAFTEANLYEQSLFSSLASASRERKKDRREK